MRQTRVTMTGRLGKSISNCGSCVLLDKLFYGSWRSRVMEPRFLAITTTSVSCFDGQGHSWAHCQHNRPCTLGNQWFVSTCVCRWSIRNNQLFSYFLQSRVRMPSFVTRNTYAVKRRKQATKQTTTKREKSIPL